MTELRLIELDDDAEDAIEELADAAFPHIMDRAQKERVRRRLRLFLKVAWRGPLA